VPQAGVQLEQHLVGENPVVGRTQRIVEERDRRLVLRTILVGCIQEDIGIEALHGIESGRGSAFLATNPALVDGRSGPLVATMQQVLE
jgi:hypothetical protein